MAGLKSYKTTTFALGISLSVTRKKKVDWARERNRGGPWELKGLTNSKGSSKKGPY